MNDDSMPTTYDAKTTTTTSSPGGLGLRFEYIRTIPGILKIVEIVLSILTFICAVVPYWAYLGGGWVTFVSMSAFISTLLNFILYFVNVVSRLPAQFNLFSLSLLTFICAVVTWFPGIGWTQFVAISAFISTGVCFFFHFCNLISHFPGPYLLIEFIYYCVVTIFFLIAAIICAVHGGKHSAIGAAAFFSFAATAVYAVDTFFQLRAYKQGQTEMTTTTHTTTSYNPEASRTGTY